MGVPSRPVVDFHPLTILFPSWDSSSQPAQAWGTLPLAPPRNFYLQQLELQLSFPDGHWAVKSHTAEAPAPSALQEDC